MSVELGLFRGLDERRGELIPDWKWSEIPHLNRRYVPNSTRLCICDRVPSINTFAGEDERLVHTVVTPSPSPQGLDLETLTESGIVLHAQLSDRNSRYASGAEA